MQVAILALLVAALGCLVIGLIASSAAWILASLVASVVAVLAIRTARRRAQEVPAAKKGIGEDTQPATVMAMPAARAAAAQADAEPAATAPAPAKPEPRHAVLLRRGRFGRKTAAAEGLSLPQVVAAVEAEQAPGTSGPASEQAEEPAAAHTSAPLADRGDDPVWVVDGRPRYHVSSCSFLGGLESASIPLRQAVEDGFSPCALCDPDTAVAAG